ncbi:MAG: hypothetical protein Q7T45_13915 [Bradyrhizobium sp.]|uniref:hypothetical protein n=1 Tax=Bradyrhizobium sp. TaxID=376 RepID=UPI002723BE12|nr:hypothetical protein [Bradyrhizobium sp.]MDO8398908.1 hypothetical protein [Bradyrhizobium sp.]
MPHVLSKLDPDDRARLEAAVARVRAAEAAMQAAFGHGHIFMMALDGAARQKLLRDRRRAGVDRVAAPEINNQIIDRLIDDKRISEQASADPKKVDAAISILLDDYAAGRVAAVPDAAVSPWRGEGRGPRRHAGRQIS